MPGAIDYHLLLRELASSQFVELRPAQAETLRRYASAHSSAGDLAIELPTGAGKSLIAQLMAEAWRRADKKAAILTGNKTLARQMEREAKALGVPVVLMEGQGNRISPRDRRRYQRADAIAIMNYWVYFNQNPGVDPADILIMDDAHLAEHCLHSLYSVEVDRFDHESLFSALVAELAARFPEYAPLQDALDPDTPSLGSAQLLSFLDQSSVAERIREIIDTSPELERHADLKFRWLRLRDQVRESNLYLSKRSLWFRPYIYPLGRNEHYAKPQQRIYMSATIGDTADLARRLGTHPIDKLELDAVHSETTYGRRLLVMNRMEDADIPERLSHAMLAALRVHPKAVWLCASSSAADRLRVTVKRWLGANGFPDHPTWLLTSLGDEIEDFKRSDSGHLFVAGRFDGMDFKADECRLVIVATLPRAIDIQEEFFAAYLRDAEFMVRRLNQRIVQALGRCNRSADDFGIYVLADRRFATHFGRESNRLEIPRNILAEIDSAEDMTEVPVAELVSRITEFLQQDFGQYDADLEEHRAALPAPRVAADHDAKSSDEREPPVNSSNEEVEGWAELFWSQNYGSARRHFTQCSQTAAKQGIRELGAFFQWCEAKAAFLRGEQGDPEARGAALNLLEGAIERGGQRSWFNRLRSSLNRHAAQLGRSNLHSTTTEYADAVIQIFDDRLEILGTRGTGFQRWADDLSGRLNSGRHQEYVEGLEKLGIILGYAAARPSYGAATDCRWRGVFGNVREVVTFEAKVEHQPMASVTPHYVGQAHNQVTRAREQYGERGFRIRGTIVTHLDSIEPAARPSLGELRIVRKSAMLALFNHILVIFSRYRDRWSAEDLNARLAAAEFTISKLPPAGWLTRALEEDGPFITAADLLREWPR